MTAPLNPTADQIAQTFALAGHDVSRDRCEAVAALIEAEGYEAALVSSAFTTDQARRDVGFYSLAKTQRDTAFEIDMEAHRAATMRAAIEAGDVRHRDALARSEARLARLTDLLTMRPKEAA